MLYILLVVWISSSTDPYTDSGNTSAPKEKTRQVLTKVVGSRSFHFLRHIANQTVIDLYIASEKKRTLYKNNTDYKNIQAEIRFINNKQEWYQLPEVYLDSKPAGMYTYYPYQKQVTFDVICIPVKISPHATLTKDYMYGTQASGQKAVNNLSPVVPLDIHHALSLLLFQLKVSKEQKASCSLHSIEIGNKAGGTALYYRGKMNIKTGDITGCGGTNASTRLNFDSPEILTSRFSSLYSVPLIPTHRILTEREVEVLFGIDGKTYTYKIPARTQWKKGYKYLYRLTFDGKKIRLKKSTSANGIPGEKEIK